MSRGRRLSGNETLRLQGIDPSPLAWDMSEGQVRAAAGNAMTVPVLREALARVIAVTDFGLGRSPPETIGFSPRTLIENRRGNTSLGIREVAQTESVCLEAVLMEDAAQDVTAPAPIEGMESPTLSTSRSASGTSPESPTCSTCSVTTGSPLACGDVSLPRAALPDLPPVPFEPDVEAAGAEPFEKVRQPGKDEGSDNHDELDLVWSVLARIGRLASGCRRGSGSRMDEVEEPVGGRTRDLFPLPLPHDLDVFELANLPGRCLGDARSFVHGLVSCLNVMYGCSRSTFPDVCRNKAQRVALSTIGARVNAYVGRLVTDIPKCLDPATAWNVFQSRGGRPPLQMIADLVDCPDFAATCDPLSLIPRKWADFICDIDRMFPCPPPGLDRFSGFYAGERKEYVSLVLRQLRCGKVVLCDRVRGGGTVFPVGKHGTLRQREVWHGSRVSAACADPPKPRWLASPSAFAAIALDKGQRLRASKRDGKCFFDQLQLPRELRHFMGRPAVQRQELLDAGATVEELGVFVDDGVDSARVSFWPCSNVWGMGFAWSSFVAQESLLAVCKRAGLDSRHALAPDNEVPLSTDLMFSLATDDVMVFSAAGPGGTVDATSRVESEMLRAGIVKHAGKDITDALSIVCVGVELVDGRWWWPPVEDVDAAACGHSSWRDRHGIARGSVGHAWGASVVRLDEKAQTFLLSLCLCVCFQLA